MTEHNLSLFDTPAPRKEPKPKAEPTYLSVGEFTQYVKGLLETKFQQVWIRGEIGNFKPSASGHVYFSLKDSEAVVSAVIFGYSKNRGALTLKEGMEVLCRGRVSVYPPRGSYQIVIDRIEPLGAGALQVAFEELKRKLGSEGLFSQERKRPIPSFPVKIAVVTSPTGAVIRDILTVLKRRAPGMEVTIVPVRVQGTEAPAELIAGIETANRLQLGDVIVVARGGGSAEDLCCFNDEKLARAVVASRLPVISAVGHETDFTITDFVADLRAPTPSAAAEIVSAGWVASRDELENRSQRLVLAMKSWLQARWMRVDQLAAKLVNPSDRLKEQRRRCDELQLRLERGVRALIQDRVSKYERAAAELQALSPLRVLERGYALVREPTHGTIVRSQTDCETGDRLQVTFHDGDRFVQVL